MKSKYLIQLALGALLAGGGLASAQAQNAPEDTTKGNEVTGNPQPPPADPLSSPQSTGQDKSSGNNMVGPNTGQATATAMHPDFETLDAGKKGYLTKGNVKTHKWLAKNFARCDLDHDGHLSQDEYAQCSK